MKFIVSLFLIAFLSYATSLFLPWWTIAIVSFLVALIIVQRPGIAFICGFLSLFILWTGLSFIISNNNNHLLAHKMSMVILQVDNPFLLILVTGLIGGVLGGLGSLTGSLLRKRTVATP